MWGFSARPLDTSSFRNWVIALRGNICRKKKMAVMEMSLWTLTSFISSWILHWKSTEGALDLTLSMPSSREESVMEIAPGGEQDHLPAQRKWRSKSKVNSGESPLIAATAQERTPLRSRVTGRGTPGEEELGCYLRVCVLCCQQHGALLTLTMGDRLGGIIAQVNEHVNT